MSTYGSSCNLNSIRALLGTHIITSICESDSLALREWLTLMHPYVVIINCVSITVNQHNQLVCHLNLGHDFIILGMGCSVHIFFKHIYTHRSSFTRSGSSLTTVYGSSVHALSATSSFTCMRRRFPEQKLCDIMLPSNTSWYNWYVIDVTPLMCSHGLAFQAKWYHNVASMPASCIVDLQYALQTVMIQTMSSTTCSLLIISWSAQALGKT